MANQLRWPNVERAVKNYLDAALTVPVYTRTGSTPPDEYVTLERSGGGGQWIDKTVDLEVAVIAGDRDRLWDLVADVEGLMWALGASEADGVYVDDVEVAFGFAFDPPLDQDVRRASATFALTVRPVGA